MSVEHLDPLPERPDEVMRSLGVDPGACPGAALDHIRASIAADLEKTQGPYRKKSTLSKMWPAFAALVLGAASFFVLSPSPTAGPVGFLVTIIAFAGAFICLCAAALAPAMPGRAEIMSMVGIVVESGAVLVEVWIAVSMPAPAVEMGIPCGLFTFALGLFPIGALWVALKKSGLPVRRLHAIALTIAGIAMSGAAVWLHCPADNAWHLLVGHVTLPVIAVIGLSLLAHRLLIRTADLPGTTPAG